MHDVGLVGEMLEAVNCSMLAAAKCESSPWFTVAGRMTCLCGFASIHLDGRPTPRQPAQEVTQFWTRQLGKQCFGGSENLQEVRQAVCNC